MSHSSEAEISKITPKEDLKPNMSANALDLMHSWSADKQVSNVAATEKYLPTMALSGIEKVDGKQSSGAFENKAVAVGHENKAVVVGHENKAVVVGHENKAVSVHHDKKLADIIEHSASKVTGHDIQHSLHGKTNHAKIDHSKGEKFVKHDSKSDGESAIKSLDFLDSKGKDFKPDAADTHSVTKGHKPDAAADGGIKPDNYKRSEIEYESVKFEKQLKTAIENKPAPSFLSHLWPF